MTDKKNGHKKNGVGRELAIFERQVLFWDDFKRGMTYGQIANKYGYNSDLVGRDIREYLKNLRLIGLRNVAEYRQVQMERIQAAYSAIWPNVMGGKTDAVNTMIRLMERESKLLGLDAPTKVDITARLAGLAEAEGVNPEEAFEIAEGVYRELN